MSDDDGHEADPERERETERRGMGQSGYGAGRSADDRSLGTQARNAAWSGTHGDRGTDDRWTGRGHQSWGAEERGGDRNPYGRGRWEEGRIGMSQGYGTQDGDRPSMQRGLPDSREPQPQPGPHRGKGPKGFEYSDERIRERVCEALADDHNIDASNIEVAVDKGEVTLTGTIEDRSTKRMAEDCVLQCSGVRDVHNQLRVRR